MILGKRCAFVVEVMGGFCGYLATVAGLASGADAAYIFEEKFGITDLMRDFRNMTEKMNDGVKRGLFLRNEKASDNYDTDFIHRLFAEEADGKFLAKAEILGNIQLGGTPSPFDRLVGLKMGTKAVGWIIEQVEKNTAEDGTVKTTRDDSACILCLQQDVYEFVPLQSLLCEADFE